MRHNYTRFASVVFKQFNLKTTFLSLLILLFGSFYYTYGQSEDTCSGLIKVIDHPVDFIHMSVKVKINPNQKLVTGEVTHTFTPLRQRVDSIFFNAVNIDIQHAYLNGKPVPYTNDGKIVTVLPSPALQWDTIDSVRFVYKAHPVKGLYFVGWEDTTGRARKQVWSQGQGNGNRYWIPLYDEQNDKMTTETTITFDDQYQVLSNGNLVSKHENADGTKTWHYRMSHPMASYLVMIGAGHYGIDTLRTASGVPVHLWYYPDQKNRVEPTYRHTAEMFPFMKKETGLQYPWGSYSEIPVRDFIHGAMENTTATVYGDFYFVDSRQALDRDFVNVNIHEFVHHWFGDYITARSPYEGWLHESFATYYAKLFEKHLYGEEHFEWMRYQEQQAAIKAAKKATISLMSHKADGDRIYKKGSAILGMLSYTYGEKAYNRVIRYYLSQHPYGLVDAYDFYKAFQEVLGVSPKWFFDEWIYRGGVPHYTISWSDSTDTGSGQQFTAVHVKQSTSDTSGTHLFRMPVTIEAHYANGKYDSIHTWIDKSSTTVTVPKASGHKISYLLFDPGDHILKTVDFQRSPAELEAQATSAGHMIDRYDAIKAMDSIDVARKQNFFIRRFNTETFPQVRAEIVRQLAPDSSSATMALYQKALQDSSVTVRLAALNALPKIPQTLQPTVEKMLTDSSYSVIATALMRLSQSFPQNIPSYLDATRGVDGPAHLVSVLWNEMNAQLGNKESLQKLVDYASYSYDFQTRVNAAQALRQLNFLNPSFAGSLLQGITTSNWRLAGPFRNIYEHFAKDKKTQKIFQQVYESHHWTSHQQSRLESLFKRSDG